MLKSFKNHLKIGENHHQPIKFLRVLISLSDYLWLTFILKDFYLFEITFNFSKLSETHRNHENRKSVDTSLAQNKRFCSSFDDSRNFLKTRHKIRPFRLKKQYEISFSQYGAWMKILFRFRLTLLTLSSIKPRMIIAEM